MNHSTIIKRISKIRTDLLYEYPFYGKILMNVRFSVAPCGTAATNGKFIIFDPEFVGRIGEEELTFVLLHELYHNVFHHPVRMRLFEDRNRFNIAADMVINSIILQEVPSFPSNMTVDGEPVMHMTPSGEEGAAFTVEQLYDMLANDAGSSGKHWTDRHDNWALIDDGEREQFGKHWSEIVSQVLKDCQGSGTGLIFEKPIRELSESNVPKIDWRRELFRFLYISKPVKRDDYSFLRPDRRFQGCEFILPGWDKWEVPEKSLEGIWFAVDVSGSISDESLNQAFSEIKNCLKNLDIQGSLSFFDTEVTDPIPISSEDKLDLKEIHGRGATSFFSVFEYLEKMEQLPRAIVILTDGYAVFPPKEMARRIPVLWILVDSEEILPPWGRSIYIGSGALSEDFS